MKAAFSHHRRAALFDLADLEAIPLLDGGAGIALWIPLADAPHAALLRAWLHTVCAHAVEAHPDLLSAEQNTHHDGRVHLHVGSNAAGRYTSTLQFAAATSDRVHADCMARSRRFS